MTGGERTGSERASRQRANPITRGGDVAEDPPREDPAVHLPRTERPDAPLYLASYLRRRARGVPATAGDGDAETPLYLRRFRERRADPDAFEAPPPLWNGEALEVTPAWADVTRSKEIVPPTAAATHRMSAQIHL